MRKEQEITEIIKYTQLHKHSSKTSFQSKKVDSEKNTKRKILINNNEDSQKNRR